MNKIVFYVLLTCSIAACSNMKKVPEPSGQWFDINKIPTAEAKQDVK